MHIRQELLDKVLVVYKPNYRYLRQADVEFPVARGRFLLGETEYAESPSHLTDVEAQLCLNQLSYIFFANEIISGRWSDGRNLTLDDYLSLRKEKMFVVDSHKIFHRETNPAEPFNVAIKLAKIRRIRNAHLASLDFNINDGAGVGNLKLVIKR